MRGPVLLDAGPLVAFLNDREQEFDWAKDQFRRLEPPLWTCEAVLTESAFLMSRVTDGTEKLLQLLARGIVTVRFSLDDEATNIMHWMRRYKNVPMSLADACLMRMAEQHRGATIFTLDSDFRIYRLPNRRQVPLIFPADRR